jgi:3-oxoacyl-[acyl-carrier-protein] synthase II
MGWVTPLGADIEQVWQRLLRGESGVGRTTLFDASNFPTQISAEVRDWDVSDVGEDPVHWRHQGRHTHFAVGAATKAVRDSGVLDSKLDPTRFGVYLPAWKSSTRSANWSRSPTCRSGIWRRCSTPKART